MAVKWTLHHKRYYFWCWGTLGIFVGTALLMSAGILPPPENPRALLLILIGIPVGLIVSIRRVVIGNSKEDLRRFEDEELADPFLDRRTAFGIELRQKYGRWGAVWRAIVYAVVISIVIALFKILSSLFVRG
ncbi:MAG: hypothetical protein HY695_14540 [Deltaproteobacteria bacterium]|nr:hypothetical protein [Deltaproteobacteria bacterium]